MAAILKMVHKSGQGNQYIQTFTQAQKNGKNSPSNFIFRLQRHVQ